jgi:fumarate hydratase subunit beta
MARLRIESPFSPSAIADLRAGDSLLLYGVVYTARDAAHHLLCQAIKQGEQLSVDLKGQTIYYCGPSPAGPGRVMGACGPTTSRRMDKFTPALLDCGLKAMIGKGERSAETRKAIGCYRAVYLVTLGGAGALLSRCVKKAEVVAYPELGTEAIMRLEILDFPAVVAYDVNGGDLFKQEIAVYSRHNK